VPHREENWTGYENEQSRYLTETSKMITIDDYVGDNQVSSISFIKCDVEAAELLVLKGAETVLRSSRPPVLQLEVFESWTRDFGYHPRDLFEFLKKEGGVRVLLDL
jgi:hypothetical protein